MTQKQTRCSNCEIIFSKDKYARPSRRRPTICTSCMILSKRPKTTWKPAAVTPYKPKPKPTHKQTREHFTFKHKQFAKDVKSARRRQGATMRKVADGAGISNPSYMKIEHAITVRPYTKTVQGVCSFLGLNPEDYYERAL